MLLQTCNDIVCRCKWNIPVPSVERFGGVIAQEEIAAGRDGDEAAVEDVGFPRAGGDAFDQGAAVVTEDYDIAGAELSVEAEAYDQAAFVYSRLHGCRRHETEIENEAEQGQNYKRAQQRDQDR